MIKKRNIVIFLFCLLLVPQSTLAADITYGYYGTNSTSSPLYANSSNGDASHWFDVSVAGTGTGYVVWGKNDGTGKLVEMSRNAVPANNVEPSGSGAIAFWLESTGGEIHATIGHTNNENNLTVYFTSSDSGESGSSGGSNCIGCDLFNCPGWSDYMGKINQIISAIPPAPNWQEVANTFRDTISPRIKSDLDDLLGRAPDPPATPAAPSIPSTPSTPPLPDAPALPSDLDDRGLTDPTGKEDPGLDDSTFDSGDIKDEAPVIQEREDPTGGFPITDPVAGLPSQEEFMKNLPNEGSATLPGNPEEGANVAPAPGDTTDTAPTPSDNSGTPPTPEESGAAPIPGDDGGTPPLPNESGTAPIPSNNNDAAPIP